MESGTLLTTQVGILLLLLVACLGAIAFKQLYFPYTVGLVIIGLGLGFLAQQVQALESLRSLELSHELILLVFVPPLVFASVINIDHHFTRLGEEAALKRLTNEGEISEQTAAKVH